MRLMIFKSRIIKPRRSWRRNRRWQVSETTPSPITKRPRKERVVVVVPWKPSFHISKRSQPIIFLNETRPPSPRRRIHNYFSCASLVCIYIYIYNPSLRLWLFWSFRREEVEKKKEEKGQRSFWLKGELVKETSKDFIAKTNNK